MTLHLQAHESLLIIANLSTDKKITLDIESSHSDIKTTVKRNTKSESAVTLDGPVATLRGEIVSFSDGSPIPGAMIFISGMRNKLRSDADVNFQTELPVGEYSLSVIHPDVSAQTVEKINFIANEIVTQHFELTPSALSLEEFTVTSPNVA